MRPLTLGLAAVLVWGGVCASHGQSVPPTGWGAAAQTATPANPPAASPPVYTRQTAFAIPYNIDRTEVRPVDVLLFVSADQGAKWSLYARQNTVPGQFLFRAARDGEYWFASRSTYPGMPNPAESTLRPELRVVVDTVEPKVNVTAALSPSGELQVTWDAFDEQLAPETLTVESQSDAEPTWRPVTFERPKDGAARTSVRGETRWWPDPGPRVVTVRVEVRDRAQNTGRAVRPVTVPAGLPARPAAEQTVARPEVPADPFARQGLPPDSGAMGGMAPPGNAVWGGGPATTLPNAAGAEFGRGPGLESQATPGEAWPSDTEQYPGANRPGARVAVGDSGPAPRTAPAADAASGSPVATGPRMVTASSAAGSAKANPASGVELPAGERPRMTRSKRFNLDYSIDAVGPAGLEKVELWVTLNGGRDWELWGIDEDRETPFLVTVEREGVYGFRVVLVSKNGLAGQTPRAGDLADLWVGVDTTTPTAEITSAAYGTDEHAGQLDIRWQAADVHLAARPITLSFSAGADGPWSTIASGLPNTGQYYWRVDSRTPDKFYLRLEVRDEAGNVGSDQLKESVLSAGLVPKGRIQGLEPLGN